MAISWPAEDRPSSDSIAIAIGLGWRYALKDPDL